MGHVIQSHNTGAVSVQCDPNCKYVITAGLDCSVQLWTNRTNSIGVFEKDEWAATQLSPGEDDGQEKAGIPGIEETRNSQDNQAVSQSGHEENKNLTNFTLLSDTVLLTHYQTQFRPHPAQTPLIRGGTNHKQSSPRTTSSHFNQTRSKYGCEIQQRDTLKDSVLTPPCPPNTLPGKQRSAQTPEHVHLPPISYSFWQTQYQTQLRQHRRQSSAQHRLP